MRVQIAYDESDGSIASIIYYPPEPKASDPMMVIEPSPGYRTAVLDIPPEFESLDRVTFHNAIRIDIQARAPRIIAVR
jgi:hypothetical protein